jgi:hypothetical protein
MTNGEIFGAEVLSRSIAIGTSASSSDFNEKPALLSILDKDGGAVTTGANQGNIVRFVDV